MSNKMLIDAAHPEETRVVVLRGNRVEEFDYESAIRQQLRGNIYLAKVTRVEPSLQAAFVDYGGNRHGFLAFSEIHPDYYQIPIADRQALLEEEAEDESRASAEEAAEDADEGSVENESGSEDKDANTEAKASADDAGADDETTDAAADASAEPGAAPNREQDAEAENITEAASSAPEEDADEESSEDDASSPDIMAAEHSSADIKSEEVELSSRKDENGAQNDASESNASESDTAENDTDDNGSEDDASVELVGSEDALEELPQRRHKRRRIYKIQEVIKKRQIILVQVVKEERGNKGAALTTYLSLAGRHTVMMPNTARGGGISRKITNPADRKRLRAIAAELEVPEGTGLIIRTAGASRTKTEIKRDFEYLLRLWENVRDLTLDSTAPALVYEEGNLIKRSIRDLYSKEIDEVLVAGDDAYREAKDFMRMLMPSHAKNVQPYKDPSPLFMKFRIERQLNAMFSPFVTLKSGGYIVINQTEALVAVDVNSGKSTREHSIEDTALRTNLEAAEEVARQLRLRDLAGLIVIDFIDMEERRNNRAVERKIKECLKNDRARIQVSRISHFGLLEMSRQRLRTGVLEGSTTQCSHCQGTGIIRSTESVALSVLRTLEDTLLTTEPCDLTAVTSVEVAIYILNQKRFYVQDIESRFDVTLTISANPALHGANFTVEKTGADDAADSSDNVVVQMNWAHKAPDGKAGADDEDGEGKKRSRRRRRGRRGRNASTDRPLENSADAENSDENNAQEQASAGADEAGAQTNAQAEQEGEQGEQRRPRRRGRRGGRRNRGNRARQDAAAAENQNSQDDNNQNGNDQDSDKGRGTGSSEEAAHIAADASAPAPEPSQVESSSDTAQTTTEESSDSKAESKPARKRKPYTRRSRASAKDKEADKPAAKEAEADKGEDTNSKSGSSARNGRTRSSAPKTQATGEETAQASSEAQPAASAPQEAAPQEAATQDKPRRRGWWQRASS